MNKTTKGTYFVRYLCRSCNYRAMLFCHMWIHCSKTSLNIESSLKIPYLVENAEGTGSFKYDRSMSVSICLNGTLMSTGTGIR
jgi:hypothetical protein